jgi:hypothetical protein
VYGKFGEGGRRQERKRGGVEEKEEVMEEKDRGATGNASDERSSVHLFFTTQIQ